MNPSIDIAHEVVAALGRDAQAGLSHDEARSDERSAFADLFTNRWLWAAVVLSLALQVAVIYLPFLQQAFSTAPLGAADWLFCTAVASSVLWLRELSKLLRR